MWTVGGGAWAFGGSLCLTSHKPRCLKRAVENDGAEVIVLGCAGMAGYSAEIEKKLNIKVIDPAAVALKVAEAMADLGLVHSKVGLFAAPPEKSFKR